MARRLRIQFPGAMYHVINRGNYRRDLFATAPFAVPSAERAGSLGADRIALENDQSQTSLFAMNPITVGAYEAKTHLAHLLSQVARGREVIITKHEKPVARLSSVSPGPRLSRDQVLKRLDELAGRVKPGSDSAKDLISAGRRI